MSATVADGLDALFHARWTRRSVRDLAWKAGSERTVLEKRLHAIRQAWDAKYFEEVGRLAHLDHADPMAYDAFPEGDPE